MRITTMRVREPRTFASKTIQEKAFQDAYGSVSFRVFKAHDASMYADG